jgi:hypothetical protein
MLDEVQPFVFRANCYWALGTMHYLSDSKVNLERASACFEKMAVLCNTSQNWNGSKPSCMLPCLEFWNEPPLASSLKWHNSPWRTVQIAS